MCGKFYINFGFGDKYQNNIKINSRLKYLPYYIY